ncbi:hypothetical protein ACVOMV_19230 [Mesorhizobium atlanticum]
MTSKSRRQSTVAATLSGESLTAEPEPRPVQDNSPAPALTAGEQAKLVPEPSEGDAQTDAASRTNHQASAAEPSQQAAGPEAMDVGAGHHDRWYFNAGDDDAVQAQPAVPAKNVPKEAVAAEGLRRGIGETAARETVTPSQPALPRAIDRSAPPCASSGAPTPKANSARCRPSSQTSSASPPPM